MDPLFDLDLDALAEYARVALFGGLILLAGRRRAQKLKNTLRPRDSAPPATVTCRNCGRVNELPQLLCRNCGTELAPAGAVGTGVDDRSVPPLVKKI